MIEALYNLPVALMALAIFAATYVVAAGIYWVVTRLAVDDRARAFKALSPGMLSPLGIIFGLLVAFVAAQVWSDFDRASDRCDCAVTLGVVKIGMSLDLEWSFDLLQYI